MKVLFATSEAHPLAKTGSLADVSGALPAALQDMGVDARVLLPGYPSALEKAKTLSRVFRIQLPEHGETSLLRGMFPGTGVPVYLIEHAGYFGRDGLYQDNSGQDWPDNALRYGLLSQFAAWLSGPKSPLDFRPDVLHCNDWQTGLAPTYLNLEKTGTAPTVFTVHNLAHQGIFPRDVLKKLGLPRKGSTFEGMAHHENISFLKAGLSHASHITTVSPTYAREIQTKVFGMGMQDLLSARNNDLTGILDGIDMTEWNSASDPNLYMPYSVDTLANKTANKMSLQGEMGLQYDSKMPLLGMISKLTPQKGMDVVFDAAPQLLELGVQLALLGNGDIKQETAWRKLAAAHPGRVAVKIGFHEGLAHRIEAGADIFLMPSRFEPCGLNQMYSQRYGTPPLVNKVGGLADTVNHANPENLANGKADGFVLERLDKDALVETVSRALILFKHKLAWQRLVMNCMARDHGWHHSAQQYLGVYRKVCKV